MSVQPITFPFPVNGELHAICLLWHGGQTSAMYSVLSTGAIHNVDILCDLARELRSALRWSSDVAENELIDRWLTWTDDQAEAHVSLEGE